jgi:hypothetical protein
MRLAALVQNNAAWPVDLAKISGDLELSRDIQGQLCSAALLDPPLDGQFGPVSIWALGEFARARRLSVANGLTREVGQALLAPGIADTLPLALDESLASKILRAMQRRGYWFSRHPECMTIVYVEGMDTDGTPNANDPNEFNDARVLVALDKQGRPSTTAWVATCEPGRFYTENPEDPGGAARIAFGQYKAWAVGTHKPGKRSAHEALVQVAPITVCRDANKDFKRDHDAQVFGIFGINQHWGFDLPKTDIGKASAGCLVGRSKDEHKDFISLVKDDARYKTSKGYRFMTAVLPVAALDEQSFDPASPH